MASRYAEILKDVVVQVDVVNLKVPIIIMQRCFSLLERFSLLMETCVLVRLFCDNEMQSVSIMTWHVVTNETPTSNVHIMSKLLRFTSFTKPSVPVFAAKVYSSRYSLTLLTHFCIRFVEQKQNTTIE